MPATARPRRFDLVVFDWDGTLFDSTGLIVRCLQAACQDCSVPVPSDETAAYIIRSSAAATATTTSHGSTSWCCSTACCRCCTR